MKFHDQLWEDWKNYLLDNKEFYVANEYESVEDECDDDDDEFKELLQKADAYILSKRNSSDIIDDVDNNNQYSPINEEIIQASGLSTDLLPFHDAVFLQNEEVPQTEIRGAIKKKFWWDEESIENEFKDNPGTFASIEDKMQYYLKSFDKS